jgi:hypothetical protein
MPGAVARSTTRHDLAALGYETLKRAHVLVVDRQGLVSAEAAYFAASTRAAASTASVTGTPFAITTSTATAWFVSGVRTAAMTSFFSFFVSHRLVSICE